MVKLQRRTLKMRLTGIMNWRIQFTAANSDSQVPLPLHQNFPTLSLRKTSGVPQLVEAVE
jgi:hypothetical protein